ncbi:MAG TPA: hypothetical protein VGI81_00165 [Tepidisphaeraceae bacterium]|jgi:hypothetical protein
MIERMNDVIVWDGFPHPDPVMRHASVTVQLAPPLWRRVLHHLMVQDAAQRAGWSSWLGEAAVATLRDALERELAHDAPRAEHSVLALPAEAVEAIRATLCASFWQPLAIWFGTGDSKSDGYYRLILTNGAVAVLRPLPADPASLLLEDLFFTQCKTKLEGDGARRLGAVAQATDRYATFLTPHRGDAKHGGTRRMPRPHGIRFVEPRIWNDLPAAPPAAPAPNPTPSESAEIVGLSRLLDSAAAGSNGLPALSNPIATTASRELRNELETWTRSTAELSDQCEHATEAYREELCLELLENRISAWARFVAIDEKYNAAMEAGDVDVEFAGEMDALLAAMESFDESLQTTESTWAPIAARVELLNNWKNRLAAPHRHALPWWMSAARPSGARARASSYLLG